MVNTWLDISTTPVNLALELEPVKTELITIRVSRAEKNILKELAKKSKLNLSQFLINPPLDHYRDEKLKRTTSN